MILLMGSGVSIAQSRKALENKRKKLIAEIRVTSNLLKKTSENKEAALDRFFALQKQISHRTALRQTLQKEIQVSVERIGRTSKVIASLQEDLNRLKDDYAGILRNAYRQKLGNNQLLFIFSASSFNEAIRRWMYLRQYERYCKHQATLILLTQQSLNEKMEQLAKRQEERELLLKAEQQQQIILNKELERSSTILKELKRDEKRLRKRLESQQQAHEQLNQTIEAVIQSEMARKRKDARSPDALAGPSEEEESENGMSNEFRQNKGRLPWPVNQGVITRWFGKQRHPTLPKVMITNNGVDIRTDPGSPVMAVFHGVVAGKQYVPGYNNLLIVRHGNYYTVYSNLDLLYVDKGDKITFKQPIGTVAVNQNSNTSELHFEVWYEKERLNPSDWIRRP